MKVRKQVHELKPADLEQAPVWEFALDEEGEGDQDEATVHPVAATRAVNPSEGLFIVGAVFTLADGTKMSGYLTPGVQGELDLGTVHPTIVTDEGQISFWRGVAQLGADHLARYYSMLGKKAHDVFPLTFASDVEIIGGPVSGVVPGFLVLESFDSRHAKVVQ